MDDFNSETDSDYTSYWRDWVGAVHLSPPGCTITKDSGNMVCGVAYGERRVLACNACWAKSYDAATKCMHVMVGGRAYRLLDTPIHMHGRIRPITGVRKDRAFKEKVGLITGSTNTPDIDNCAHTVRQAAAVHRSNTGLPLAPDITSVTVGNRMAYGPTEASSAPDPNNIPNQEYSGPIDRGYIPIGFITFISSRGNEYFCEIDEEYLTDRFNLTGLQTEVQYYQYALDLVTDVFDIDCDDDMRDQIEKSARHLYGLVHARYIVTTRGLAKMLEKFKKSDFGKCPRVMCESQPLLPMGQSDVSNTSAVKLYCARCEDLYNPKSSRHSVIDGAYFGTSFHNILFQVYPAMLPPKSQKRYEPRVFGFKMHAAAALARWQEQRREEMKGRLRGLGLETGFEDEEGEEESEEDEEMEGVDAGETPL